MNPHISTTETHTPGSHDGTVVLAELSPRRLIVLGVVSAVAAEVAVSAFTGA